MADKKVHVGGGMTATGDGQKGTNGGEGGDNPLGLSEGVMRATGVKASDYASGYTPSTEMGESNEPHLDFMWLQEHYHGIIERNTNQDGSIVLRFVYGDGDVATAKAADTRTALTALIEKMKGVK